MMNYVYLSKYMFSDVSSKHTYLCWYLCMYKCDVSTWMAADLLHAMCYLHDGALFGVFHGG